MWAKARKGDLAPQPGYGCEGVVGGGLEPEVEGDETLKSRAVDCCSDGEVLGLNHTLLWFMFRQACIVRLM